MDRLVFGYAEEIFGLGRVLLEAVQQGSPLRPRRLVIEVDDVLPKEVARSGPEWGHLIRDVAEYGKLWVARIGVEQPVALGDAHIRRRERKSERTRAGRG